MCDPHDPHHSHGGARQHPEPSPQLRPTLSRRGLLAAAGGGLLLAAAGGPRLPGAVAAPTRPGVGALRSSLVTAGTTLVHADLHNHTLLSDGDGNPDDAFVSMRAAGLDVAALTDHATLSDHLLGDPLTAAMPAGYSQLGGLTREGWERTGVLADGADRPGAFTAMRGFEWSEPTLGHVNVWFTDEWTDVVDLGQMGPLYRWLARQTNLVGLGDGGAEGIAGFNHPGREPGRFEEFRFDPSVRDQMVSLEMFNRRDDYLFEGYELGDALTPDPLSLLPGREPLSVLRGEQFAGPPERNDGRRVIPLDQVHAAEHVVRHFELGVDTGGGLERFEGCVEALRAHRGNVLSL